MGGGGVQEGEQLPQGTWPCLGLQLPAFLGELHSSLCFQALGEMSHHFREERWFTHKLIGHRVGRVRTLEDTWPMIFLLSFCQSTHFLFYFLIGVYSLHIVLGFLRTSPSKYINYFDHSLPVALSPIPSVSFVPTDSFIFYIRFIKSRTHDIFLSLS